MMEATYNYLFVEPAAARTREWPLVSSPFPLTFLIIGYLFFILYAGPRYMKNRPPYKLKTFMLLYNVIQILANIWVIKEHISSGWFSEYNIIMHSVSSPDSSNAIKIVNMCWWIIFLKIFDLFETVAFVLRKKYRQVSFLHVYHHIGNIFFNWLFLKYATDERTTIVSLLNCGVHVIMYTYYLYSSSESKYQSIVSSVKPYVTRIQMVQFFIMLIYFAQFASPAIQLQKPLHGYLFALFVMHVIMNIILFSDFYIKSYTDAYKEKRN